jgi:hypothetical protein
MHAYRAIWLVFVAALLCLLSISAHVALAADPGPEAAAARTIVRTMGISWEPLVTYESAVLTVSGPDDFLLRREFVAHDSLRLDVTDHQDGVLTNGKYTWELRFAPILTPEAKSALREARKRGDPTVAAELKHAGWLPESPMVISGHFRIEDGSIVTPYGSEDLVEGSTPEPGPETEPLAPVSDADSGAFNTKQLITGDLTVRNSLCVGFDCADAESYGTDTIRLKENTLRIKADDTSTIAGYPANDWQLTFNDSTSGGASKFSIDDISGGRTPFTIEANARTNSIYVDDGGRVGFRTSTPNTELHVIDGDTPTLRLEQDGSSGFAPQTWDVAGNETSFFIRDVTNGSTLPFRIFPGAASSSLVIDGDNQVGVGTTTPTAPIDVEGNSTSIGFGNAAVRMANSAGGVAFQLDADSNISSFWNISTVSGDSYFRVSRSGTGSTELQLSQAGDLEISGDLTVVGGCTGCDAVFEPGYDLESIEEHAEFMWKNGFLRAVGPTAEGKTKMKVFEKTAGILNELEKAHIYIEQLREHARHQEMTIRELESRLHALEKAVNADQQ